MRGAMQVWVVTVVVVVVGDGETGGSLRNYSTPTTIVGLFGVFLARRGFVRHFSFPFHLPTSPSPPASTFQQSIIVEKRKSFNPRPPFEPSYRSPPHLHPPPRCPESVSSALPRATWRPCPTPRFRLLTASSSPSSAPRPR